MSDKSILAGSAKDRNVAETYVLVQNLTPIIQRLLANDPAVTEMRVLGFQLSNDDIQAIAYALTENKTLRALSLDHLQIGDEGAKQLSQGLCYNESLTYLSLRWNNLSNEGGAAIADSLHYNKGIKTLVLSFNNLGPAAGQAFAAALKRNSTMETLDLKWNQIDDEAGDMILDAMSENTGALSSLMLGGNGSTLRNVGKATGDGRSSKRAKSMRFGFGSKDKKTGSEQTISLEQLKKDLANVAASQEMADYEEDEEEEARELEVGDLIEVRGNEPGAPARRGRVRYIGTTEFADGIWVGIEFEGPVGMNDGMVEGKRYFTCPPKRGSFLRPDKLVFLDEEFEE